MPQPPNVEPIFVSVKDAARILSVSPWLVYKLLDDKDIDSQYQGRRRLVRLDSIRKYASTLPRTAPDSEVSA